MISYDRNTAILLILFRRPDTTQKVFERIREVKPKRLYLAADGPRNEKERMECDAARAVDSCVDWDCEVVKLYQEQNLGCDSHCHQAISWFFEQEPEGIILEDDCVPSLSFFGFCTTLLEKYRNDERIGHITGGNYQFGKKRGDGTYFFSNLTHVGGWAGWRRVWKEHTKRSNDFDQFSKLDYLAHLPSHAPFQHHWDTFYTIASQGNNDICWDYKYAYSNLINNRLSIIPNRNLICNIGCYDRMTHYIKEYPFANLPCEELEEIVHPTFMCPDIEADLVSQSKEYNVSYESYFMEDDCLYLKKRLESYAKGEKSQIPKIVHQVYEDLSGPPVHLIEISRSWREFNPDWDYCFWNKNDIEAFIEREFPDFKTVYNAFQYPVQRWDAIRYLILYQFGGLYVDMDYECTEPIAPLLNGVFCAIGLEPKAHAVRSHMPYIVGNAFMATIPQHPFIGELIKEVFQTNDNTVYQSKGETVLETTGPYKVTKLYKQSEYQNQVTLIPAALVTPLAQEEVLKVLNGQVALEIENRIEKSYAIHYFFGSWYKP